MIQSRAMTPQEYKAERKLRGTQAEVSDLLGIQRETVSRRETGSYVITREAALAISALPKKKSK